MRKKTKRILTIIGVSLLLIATLGTFMAFFGKNDLANFKDKVEDAFVKEEETAINNNILKNSNFSQNSGEIKIFTHDNVVLDDSFTDDWVCHGVSSNFEAYQISDGLYVSNNSTESIQLTQFIENGVSLYCGKEITATVSVDGVVYSATFVVNSGEFKSVEFPTASGLVIRCSGSTTFKATLSIGQGQYFINWVKLELGNVFTGYVPPVVVE